jgi:hypothetical protein
VTAQAWRSEHLALWVEGGAGYVRVREDAEAVSSRAIHVASGLGLHWRYEDWGAALRVGRVGSETVLSVLGGWQVWRHVGLALTWQRFENHTGTGLAIGVGF